MKTDWTLRQVLSSDAARVAAHGHPDPADSARRAPLERWLRPRIESGSYLGCLAVSGDAVVGGAGAILLDWGPTRANPGGRMARINNVYVEEPWRGRGVARALLQAVLAQCEAIGVREFNLGATEAARALYTSLGFEPYPAEMRRRVPSSTNDS